MPQEDGSSDDSTPQLDKASVEAKMKEALRLPLEKAVAATMRAIIHFQPADTAYADGLQEIAQLRNGLTRLREQWEKSKKLYPYHTQEDFDALHDLLGQKERQLIEMQKVSGNIESAREQTGVAAEKVLKHDSPSVDEKLAQDNVPPPAPPPPSNEPVPESEEPEFDKEQLISALKKQKHGGDVWALMEEAHLSEEEASAYIKREGGKSQFVFEHDADQQAMAKALERLFAANKELEADKMDADVQREFAAAIGEVLRQLSAAADRPKKVEAESADGAGRFRKFFRNAWSRIKSLRKRKTSDKAKEAPDSSDDDKASDPPAERMAKKIPAKMKKHGGKAESTATQDSPFPPAARSETGDPEDDEPKRSPEQPSQGKNQSSERGNHATQKSLLTVLFTNRKATEDETLHHFAGYIGSMPAEVRTIDYRSAYEAIQKQFVVKKDGHHAEEVSAHTEQDKADPSHENPLDLLGDEQHELPIMTEKDAMKLWNNDQLSYPEPGRPSRKAVGITAVATGGLMTLAMYTLSTANGLMTSAGIGAAAAAGLLYKPYQRIFHPEKAAKHNVLQDYMKKLGEVLKVDFNASSLKAYPLRNLILAYYYTGWALDPRHLESLRNNEAIPLAFRKMPALPNTQTIADFRKRALDHIAMKLRASENLSQIKPDEDAAKVLDSKEMAESIKKDNKSDFEKITIKVCKDVFEDSKEGKLWYDYCRKCKDEHQEHLIPSSFAERTPTEKAAAQEAWDKYLHSDGKVFPAKDQSEKSGGGTAAQNEGAGAQAKNKDHVEEHAKKPH